MKLKNVSHYAIYDQKFDNWKSEVLDRWTYDDFVRDPQYKKKWISITSLAYHQPSDAVYLGIGSFSAEHGRARRRISSPSRWIASAGSSMGLAQYRRYSFATTSTRAKAV